MNKLFTVFISSILCLACAILLSTCAKEYSYEGGTTDTSSGTAVYTLNGAGGSCSNAVVEGKYYSGVQLSAADIIKLQAHVTTIGAYSLTTNSVNGIQFSSSGSFADTGVQYVTLAGSGTPVSAGSITFTPAVVMSCSFTIEVSSQPVVPASFTLAGAPNECSSIDINGIYIYGKPMTSANFVAVTADVTQVGPYVIKTDTIDGINFSDSGRFTATGIQKVTLHASGTAPLPGILTFTPSASNSSCTFTITMRVPEPLAVYVLESGQDTACTNYTVNGTYTSSSSLTSSNTVTLKVYATEPGNLSIATNVVNGIMFSYIGSFAAAGDYYVVLTGTGTPIASGTFKFTPRIVGPHPIGGEACSFELVVR